MRLTTADIAAATGGTVIGANTSVEGAAIDSRGLTSGQLFVAVVDERDGHDFLDAAREAGAGAALVGRGRDPIGPSVEVDDTRVALGALGRLARLSVPDRVIAVTGSVGKTSVKDLTAAALAGTFEVAASERSFNNELGVPLTLLNAPETVEAMVIEMGARGRGQVAALCEIARPTVGVVTSVAVAHTEQFGSLEEVAETKGELVAALPASGVALLAAGDDRVMAMADRTDASVLSYGVEEGDLAAVGVAVDDELRPRFELRTPWGDAEVALAVAGRHNVANAAGAAGAALVTGADLDDVVAGLARAALSPWRMDVVRAPSGAVVINDAYNANPTSMRAALDGLAALPARRRIAVLGLMAELGDRAHAEHAAIAEAVDDAGAELIAVATDLYGGEVVPDVRSAEAALGQIGEGDAILVKGSRVAGLEELVDRLVG